MELQQVVLDALSNTGLDIRDCDVRVLRPSKSRPVMQYAITCFDAGKNAAIQKLLIGKGYYRDDGALVFAIMSQLWLDGFGRDPLLTIPEPVAYVPEVSLLLQGRAPGRALYEYLERPDTAEKQVRMAARWLAKLHAADVGTAPVLGYDAEEKKIGVYSTVLAQVAPEFAERITAIGAYVISSLRIQSAYRPAPTHGDFQPKNIYVFRNRVTVIDFDRFSLAHPARDLGHFIGQCMTMSYVRAGSFAEVARWNAAFLDEYARYNSAEPFGQLPVYIARTFLEVLYYKLFVRPVKDRYFLPAWLNECERWVEQFREYGSESA